MRAAASETRMPTNDPTLAQRFEHYKAMNLSLSMARGQPCTEQFDLSNALWAEFDAEKDYQAEDGLDCRNYPGGPYGLPEARKFFAEVLEVEPNEVIVGDNASLQLMQNVLTWALLRGVSKQSAPWITQEAVKVLCPVPGYDRHFTVCESLGIEMIPVPMTEQGPDMEVVARLAAADASIKAIWCVPRYSNPTGIVYSDKVIDALASMKTAASDFRILADNAYAVHHLDTTPPPMKNLLAACKEAGNPDRVLIFGSTSKVTFAGAGVCFMGASVENIEYFAELFGTQSIGPNKINQLRHVRFLEGVPGGLAAHMQRHAELIRPKFEVVEEVLTAELAGTGLATWTKPRGGYFVSLDTQAGMASRVVAMAKEVGLTLTGAGAAFPYGKDPADSNIRIAPTRPSLDEVRLAMEILAVCIKLAAEEQQG